jgi:hypothetical protein
MGTRGYFRGGKAAVTTHLHLVPKSKNAWWYTSTPQYDFMAWCLVKHGDNFTFNVLVIQIVTLRASGRIQSCPVEFPRNLIDMFLIYELNVIVPSNLRVKIFIVTE